jgi:hypothetical protein
MLAHALRYEGFSVDFLGLYDPVDMDITVHIVDSDATIPPNVLAAAVAFRDPKARSRPFFNRVDAGPEYPRQMKFYEENYFFGTHSALGGAPWAGDHPSTPSITVSEGIHSLTISGRPIVTRDMDNRCSRQVDKWMRSCANRAGIRFAPRPPVLRPDAKPPTARDRVNSELNKGFSWPNWRRALGGF